MSDADLVDLVLRGKRDRFTELVDRYLPMLRGLCASYVADTSAQQDLVQEIFVYAYERLGVLRDGDRFGSWLARIGRSHCIDWLRKQRREDRARGRAATHAPAPLAENGETVAMRRELREWVRARIAQLPAKTREAMALCYIEGCDSKEAARFLGVHEAALRKRLEYGRKLVGEKVCEELGEAKTGAGDFAALRKRVLLALPAAAIPVKTSAAAGAAGILGGIITVKSALIAVAIGAVALGLLYQGNREAEQPEASIAQAVSSSNSKANPTGSGAVSASGAAEESGAQDKADGGKVYDRFFFIRYNTEKDRVQSSTLVLATVTSDGFEFTDWYTRSGQWSGLWPLYVGAGRVFAETSEDEDSLISINTQTGSVDKVAAANRLCVGPGKLYEAIRNGDTATIRVYDFSRQAHCDLVRIPWNSQIRDVEVSPDNRYLAYFAPKRSPGSSGDAVVWSSLQALNIVDLHSGVVSEIGSSIEHREPAISSAMYGTPPFTWLDSTNVLVVRAEYDSGDSSNSRVYSDGSKRYLASIDTNTGESRDLVEIPGNPMLSRVRLRPGEWDERPVVDVGNVRGAGHDQFLVDVDRRSLSEYDGIGGAYRLMRIENGYTLYGGTKVVSAMTGNVDYAVSPDGRLIVWTEINEPKATHRDGNYYPMKLRYYDAGQGNIREVAEGYFGLGGRCWLSDEDLARAVEPAPKDEGWVPFTSEPWPEQRPRKPDPRPDVNEHLALEVVTDAEAYWLHQPIEVSVTLTNVGNSALTLLHPAVFDERTMHTRIEGPGGRGLVSQIQTYLPEPEEIVLGPGESVTATGTLELPREGTYSITAEFRGLADDPSQRFRGKVQAEAAAFEIHRSTDDSALFQEKVERLLAKATAEFESAPDWEGANETLDSLGAMGVEAGPDLLTFISSVEDSRFRVLLLRPLIDIAYPEAMPYFAELLEYGTPGEQDAALRGLDTLYRRHKGCERDDIAQSALIHLMTAAHINDARARGTLVRSLSKVKDDRVREALERFVDDPEESIRDTAARYLARHDGLELADWIARAAAQPSATQYSIARSLVSQLERTWRVNNGDFPEGDWSQVGSDATATAQYRATLLAWERWARENPRSAGQLLNPPQE